MSPEERKKWVARGFQDPKRAYLQNIGSARKRGIEFKLTFDEWWALWEPHYEKRGQHIDCMALCRTKDKGAYEAGNVRIDTVRANIEERTAVYREDQRASGRLPAVERSANPEAAAWVQKRGAWGLDYYSLRKLAEEDPESFSELVDNF
jgi:hypothetical protein